MKYIAKFNKQNSFWPNIYDYNSNIDQPIKYKKINKNNELFYYDGEGKLCMYSASPCTNLEVHEKLNFEKRFSYKVYFLKIE